MKNIFEGLRKTRERLIRPLQGMFSAGSIDEETVEGIEEILYSADIGVDATERIVSTLRERGASSPDEGLRIILGEIVSIMSEVPPYEPPAGSPRVIVIVGVNGVGKTSTIGKLAARLRGEGRRVVVAAGDTFRAAAIEQLESWADRAGASMVRHGMGADPAAVAFDAVQSALAGKADTVIVDTAGRLHTRTNLMEELQKIFRVISSRAPGVGLEAWLVVDANAGQNSVRQAEAFSGSLPLTGMVLTKLDSTAKGGAVIPIQKDLRLPVLYAGTGEDLDDLEPFDGKEFARALLGM